MIYQKSNRVSRLHYLSEFTDYGQTFSECYLCSSLQMSVSPNIASRATMFCLITVLERTSVSIVLILMVMRRNKYTVVL